MKSSAGLASWDRLNRLRKKRRFKNLSTLGLVVLGPFLAVVTYLGFGPFELDPTSKGIRFILLADLVYVLVIAGRVHAGGAGAHGFGGHFRSGDAEFRP